MYGTVPPNCHRRRDVSVMLFVSGRQFLLAAQTEEPLNQVRLSNSSQTTANFKSRYSSYFTFP